MQADDKPRLVRVTDPAEIEAVQAGAGGELGFPCGLTDEAGNWWADATELAKWRAGAASSAHNTGAGE